MFSSKSGFTLLELLIALSLAVICTAIALPPLKDLASANKLKSETRDLKNLLVRCRLEAIRLNQSVTLIFNDGSDRVVAFNDKNNSCERDSSLEVVLWQKKFSTAIFDTEKSDGDGLTFSNNDNGYPCIRWDARGLPHCNSGGFGAGTAYLCTKNHHYCVIVSKSGNIRIDTYQ